MIEFPISLSLLFFKVLLPDVVIDSRWRDAQFFEMINAAFLKLKTPQGKGLEQASFFECR